MSAPQYVITNYPAGTTSVRADNTSIDVTQTGQYGIIEILGGLNNTNNYSATFFLDFSTNNIAYGN